MEERRGDIGSDFYAQFYETAKCVDIVGIACRDFMKNFMPSSGSAHVGNANGGLAKFKQTQLFSCLKSRELTVNACFLNPWSRFVKIRMEEENNSNCRRHILDEISAMEQLCKQILDSPEHISGSLNIKLFDRNPYLSIFRAQYRNGIPAVIRAGILVQGVLGINCPEVPIESNGPWADVFTTLSDHITVIQVDAHPLFTWSEGLKPVYTAVRPKLSQCDVIILYNTADVQLIERLKDDLKERGKVPWVAVDELQFATGPWLDELMTAMRKIPCAVYCEGRNGSGDFQGLFELNAVTQAVTDGRVRVIPVKLPGWNDQPHSYAASNSERARAYLNAYQWVNLEQDWGNGVANLVNRIGS